MKKDSDHKDAWIAKLETARQKDEGKNTEFFPFVMLYFAAANYLAVLFIM